MPGTGTAAGRAATPVSLPRPATRHTLHRLLILTGLSLGATAGYLAFSQAAQADPTTQPGLPGVATAVTTLPQQLTAARPVTAPIAAVPVAETAAAVGHSVVSGAVVSGSVVSGSVVSSSVVSSSVVSSSVVSRSVVGRSGVDPAGLLRVTAELPVAGPASPGLPLVSGLVEAAGLPAVSGPVTREATAEIAHLAVIPALLDETPGPAAVSLPHTPAVLNPTAAPAPTARIVGVAAARTPASGPVGTATPVAGASAAPGSVGTPPAAPPLPGGPEHGYPLLSSAGARASGTGDGGREAGVFAVTALRPPASADRPAGDSCALPPSTDLDHGSNPG